MNAAILELPQSLNLYAYADNNPIDFVDPSGLNRQICFGYHVTIEYYLDGKLIGSEYLGFYATHCITINDGNDGGGTGGGSGNSPGDKKSDDIPEGCKKALKKAKLLNKVEKLLKNLDSTILDVNKIQDEPASKYFGTLAKKGQTVGDFYDDRVGDNDSLTSIAGKTPKGKPIGKTAIYARGGASAVQGTLRLHEVTHLAYPVGRDLDISLAKKLGVKYDKGKTARESGDNASHALSDYFNSGCDPNKLDGRKSNP